MIYGKSMLKIQRNLRISQGSRAKLGQIPYISTIHRDYSNFTEPVCSGVILSETCILSTAYCAYYCSRVWKCKLFVGRVSVWSDGKEVDISEIKWHNTFNAIIPEIEKLEEFDVEYLISLTKELFEYDQLVDLGVFRATEITFSNTVNKAVFPDEELQSTKKLLISGWFKQENGEPYVSKKKNHRQCDRITDRI